jgi:chemotaxis protein histidine kinase CheA
MSDDFLKVARQEIKDELDLLEQVISNCKNDDHIFMNSEQIEVHLHKIKGLAPMMNQKKIGEIAKTSDAILNHIINTGTLKGSYTIIVGAIEKMTNLFNGNNINDVNDFRDQVRAAFPEISEW